MQINKSLAIKIFALLIAVSTIAFGFLKLIPGLYARQLLKNNDIELSSKEFVDSACRQDVGTVVLMLEAGMNVNAQSPDEHRTNINTSALHCVAVKGDLRLINLLLDHGASLESLNQIKETPLMSAVSAPPRSITPTNIDVINALLSKGANINAISENGTVLHIACRTGNMNLVNLLLDHGANPALLDSKGMSPLNVCTGNMYNGAEVPFDRLLVKGVNIDAVDSAGGTALFRAVQSNNIKLVEKYLALGANPNFVDSSGNALLAIAVRRIEMAELLLSKGADVNINGKNGTALMAAIASRSEPVVGFLLSKGADVKAADQQGNTALHLAVQNANTASILRMLLSYGASPNVKNSEGNTPLHLAARNHNADVLNILLANGADVNAKNYSGQTPLLLAKGGSSPSPLQQFLMSSNRDPSLSHSNPSEIEKTLIRHGGKL